MNQEGRQTVVGTFPIGIDFEAFERDAKRPEIAAHAADLRKRVSDDVLAVGRGPAGLHQGDSRTA